MSDHSLAITCRVMRIIEETRIRSHADNHLINIAEEVHDKVIQPMVEAGNGLRDRCSLDDAEAVQRWNLALSQSSGD